MDPVKCKVNLTFEIDERVIADLLSTALEGGMGYWAAISGYKKPEKPRAVALPPEIFKYIDYALTGGAVYIEDCDGGKHTLDEAAIQRGLWALAEKFPERLRRIVDGDGDAEDGDVFLQLALLGEVVYG